MRNIVHIEIPTANPKQSGEFYEKLFGWHITHDDNMDYTMWDPHDAPGPGGGFTKLDKDTKPGDVLIYVDSDDIEADLKQAVALGGTLILPKTDIPTVGWFGIFKDPTGNSIALFKSLPGM